MIDKDKRFYLYITVACAIIYVFPIILSNTYYIDDMDRVMYAYGLRHEGRILYDIVIQTLSFGSHISDLYPYAQILAASLMAMAGYIIANLFDIEAKSKFKISALVLFTNPFFVENLSYRLDSLTMSLSIFICILPFIYYKNTIKFVLASIICTLCSLFLYQQSILCYACMVLLCIIFLIKTNENMKKLATLCFLSSASLILTIILFKLIYTHFGINFGGRNTTILSSNEPFLQLYLNYKNCVALISLLFTPEYIISILSIAIISASLLFINFFSSKEKWKLFVIATAILLIILCIPAINLILENPWWTSRTFGAYPFLFYALLIAPVNFKEILVKISTSIMLLFSLSFMTAYASTLNANDKFLMTLSNQISSKIGDTTDIKLIFNGTMPSSPARDYLEYKYPLIKKIVPSYMDNGWYWGTAYLKFNGVLNSNYFISGSERDEQIKNICSFNLISKETYFNILKKDDYAIIDFNKIECSGQE